MLQELTLGIREHERLASLGIAQHVLDEGDGIAFEARECRASSCSRAIAAPILSNSVGQRWTDVTGPAL